MKKTILEIYGFAVCFSSVACFMIVLGIALYDVVQVVNPQFTLNRYIYDRYQTNDAYRNSPMTFRDADDPARKATPEEDITKRRNAEFAQALESERHSGEQSIVRMAIIMFIDAIAFVIHWQIAKRARQSGA